ncbi:MAG: hypothetical protein EXS10_02840 [Phycisphaerales bacterium]|nr:hypothetical protein [Phycisphaerales bacterium]
MGRPVCPFLQATPKFCSHHFPSDTRNASSAMRTDHHAYQQATRVAGYGLLGQTVLGFGLLLWGWLSEVTILTTIATWMIPGILAWLALVIVFHQHRLERLEALELDDAPSIGEDGRLFSADDARIAAKRLKWMHAWLMPIASVLYALLLVGFGLYTLRWFGKLDDANADVGKFNTGDALGWQLAATMGLAVLAFIFSRWVAGMAVHSAWANLRGGAGIMVGNALTLLAAAVGAVLAMLEKPTFLEGICQGIAIFMIAVAVETVFGLILNLYRPRRANEVPRAAFDSRVLSLFAAPDSIVRSINEAVNYQFGFEISSSWGYQLLLRNAVRLGVFGVVVILALTTLVIVGPGEQAMRLRFGAIVGNVLQGEPMFKLPWPIDTAIIDDVSRVRELPLGIPTRRSGGTELWSAKGGDDSFTNVFLVAAGTQSAVVEDNVRSGGVVDLFGGGRNVNAIADEFAVVEVEIVLQYRVRDRELDKWLNFTSDTRSRRSSLDMRSRTLRAIAMREATQFLSTKPLEEVFSPQGQSLLAGLSERVQRAFDDHQTGVELVGVAIPQLRPPLSTGDYAGRFEELSVSAQNARRMVESARSTVNTTMSLLIGDAARAAEIVKAIEELRESERASADPQATALMRAKVETMLLDARAQTASVISSARAKRWELLMDAKRQAAEVLGQSASWAVSPELYEQRRTMEALAEALAMVRVKYIIGIDPDRVRVDAEMKEAASGLNLADYMEKKTLE